MTLLGTELPCSWHAGVVGAEVGGSTTVYLWQSHKDTDTSKVPAFNHDSTSVKTKRSSLNVVMTLNNPCIELLTV